MRYKLKIGIISIIIIIVSIASCIDENITNISESVEINSSYSLPVGDVNYSINDYFDSEVDKINHPKRPIPLGLITLKGMLFFSILFFSIGLILSLVINILCFSIGLISIILLIIYESSLKNNGLSGNIIVAFVSSISFTFGGSSVGNPYSSAIISIMAFFIILGREIIMDVRDFDGDKLLRITIPMKLGKKNAVYIACIFLIISGLITPIRICCGY